MDPVWLSAWGVQDPMGVPPEMQMNAQFNPQMYSQMYNGNQFPWAPLTSMLSQHSQNSQPSQQQQQIAPPVNPMAFHPAMYNSAPQPSIPMAMPVAIPTPAEKKRGKKRNSAMAQNADADQQPKTTRYGDQQALTPPQYVDPNFAHSTPAPPVEPQQQQQWNGQFYPENSGVYPMPQQMIAMPQQPPPQQPFNADSTLSSGYGSTTDRSTEYDSSGQVIDVSLPAYLLHEEAVAPDGLVFRKPNENDVVGEVPGRLALLNNNKKYSVRINEVIRRLLGPENLNLSLLGAVLRRAKNKGGGKNLQDLLAKHNLFVPQGKRRSMENTAFTALCEDEAMKLAADFGQLTEQFFPVDLFIKEINNTMRQRRHELAERLRFFVNQPADDDCQMNALIELNCFLMHAAWLVLGRDRSLIEWGLEKEPEEPLEPLNAELQDKLRDFNLVTHGFGLIALKAIFSTLAGLDINAESPDNQENVRSNNVPFVN